MSVPPVFLLPIYLSINRIITILVAINQAVRRNKKTNDMMMENTFNPNRVYSWGELARLYFPYISQKSATGQLLKWIRVSDKLMRNLKEAGWHPGLKYLTPRQRDYIVGHLGEP